VPNLKVYVDDTVWQEHRAALAAALGPIRSMLCERLKVDVSACQLALVPVTGLPDQPLVNAEIFLLPKPDRTREALEAVCRTLRGQLSQASGGAGTAVRCNRLDPEVYFSIR
jgi:hypothetical protein